MCRGLVNARKGPQVIGRRAVDVHCVLLLHTFNRALNDRFRIAGSGRGCVGCLLTNFIGAGIMPGATGKNNSNEQYEGRKFHVYLDAKQQSCG